MSLRHTSPTKIAVQSIATLGALLVWSAGPVLAQSDTADATPSPEFEAAVQQGQSEISQDPQAQELQKQVVDSEDQQAGDDTNQNIDVRENLQEAPTPEGETDQTLSTSEVDQTTDGNNLDTQSQTIIDEQSQASIDEQMQDGVEPAPEDAGVSDQTGGDQTPGAEAAPVSGDQTAPSDQTTPPAADQAPVSE